MSGQARPAVDRPDRSAEVFGGRVRTIVVGLALVSLAATVGAMVFGRQLAPPPAQPRDSYGPGPLGHRAFVDTMRALGVHVTRWTHPGWADVTSPLFVIEPNAPEILIEGELYSLAEILEDRAALGRRTVLVLPKWKASQDGGARPELTADLDLLLDALPLEVWLAAPETSDERRTITARAEDGTSRELSLRRPQRLTGGVPVLMDEAGSFVVRDPERLLWIVADPDLLHSHNLQRADHAAFLFDLVRTGMGADAIAVDEVFHGSVRTRSIAELFSTWPGVLGLVHAALVVVVLLAMGRRRFGPPAPAPPALGRGPREVIDVAASVLAQGSRVPTLALRYVEDLVLDAHRRLGLGEAKTPLERAKLVDIAAERRRISPRAVALLSRARELELRRRPGEALANAREASFFRARLLGQAVSVTQEKTR